MTQAIATVAAEARWTAWFERARSRFEQEFRKVFDHGGLVDEVSEKIISKEASLDFVKPRPGQLPVLPPPVFEGPSFKEQAAGFADKVARMNGPHR